MINQKRLVKTFTDLVQIDSPSGSEQKMAEEMMKRLKKLGFKVEQDKYGNVIGKIDGEGETLLLNAHLDTVEPGRGIKPIINEDTIKTDQSTILGADCKAGNSIILEALESVIEDKKKLLPLEIVLTCGEETGLLGSINLDYSKVTAKRGVTFDGDDEVNKITVSGPGYNRVDLTITGKGAHAGVEPEKGLSAIKIAAEIINQLEVGRIDHETTANIGLIEGGSARNAVPETVHIRGEIRSRDLKKLEKHSQHFQDVIDKVILKHPEAKYSLDLHREFDPYKFDENHSVIKLVTEKLKELKLTPHLEDSGGGTDVNIFQLNGIEAVAVGACLYNAHTVREYTLISKMVEAAKFCEKLIMA